MPLALTQAVTFVFTFVCTEHKFIQCKFDLLAKKKDTKITYSLTPSCPAEQMFN